MKKKLIKKLSLNKQTVADLHIGAQTNIKAGAAPTYKTCLFPECEETDGCSNQCTGITCQVPTGCVPAEPTECSSPTYSLPPWPCPC